MSDVQYDLFLSHNSADKAAVEQIALRLEAEGVSCWLDKWCLVPGDPWQPAAENALRQCRACAVFFGASGGVGPWHHEEMRVAITRQVQDRSGGYRVIMVLLPGARPDRSNVPDFLRERTRVDFEDSLEDENAIHRLVCGIRGIPPGPEPSAAIFEGQCPYPGLEPFTEDQARFFFGRETQVQWLLDKLRDARRTGSGVRFLAIVGASGSGKSSLALAGLIPALRAGQHSSHWPLVVTRPGSRPHESLAIALQASPTLAAAAGDSLALSDLMVQDSRRLHHTIATALHNGPKTDRALILVDQFEEIFTLCDDEVCRQAFVENLLDAATLPSGKAIVLLTMRADFYGHCAAYPRLAAAVSDHQDLVPPLKQVQLREAIQRPAQLTGCEVEPALVDALLDEMQGKTGALPLLQHVLRELWQRRSGRRLTYKTYQAIGRLGGALERRADEVYAELGPAQQEFCRRIFVRLTQLGRGTEDTKRRVSLSELLPMGDDAHALEELLQHLADSRLVTTSVQGQHQADRTVEVAHEALIRSWGRLRGWIDERRESLVLLDELRDAAQRWHDHDRDADFLYHGLPLQQAETLAQDPEIDLSPLQNEFLDASVRELVDQFATAETARVTELSSELQPHLGRARPHLEQLCRDHPAEARQRLHAALALLPTDPDLLTFLRDRMLDAPLEELFVVAEALIRYRGQLVETLWPELGRDGDVRPFHAALALAKYDPPTDATAESRWQPHAPALAGWLVDAVAMNPSRYSLLLDALRPVRQLLLSPLAGIYRHDADDRRRAWSTSFLADYAVDQPHVLGDLVLDADPRQFSVLLERLRPHGDRGWTPAKTELDKAIAEEASEDAKEVLAKRQANAASVLLHLGQEEAAWPAFRHSTDPRARSYLVHRLAHLDVSPQILINRLDHETDVSALRALLLALGDYDTEHLREDVRQTLIPTLAELYRDHPDPGLHASAQWLLRQWGSEDLPGEIRAALRETESHLQDRSSNDPRGWYIASQDHTMVIVDGGTFMMGSTESDPDRGPDEKLHSKHIGRRFAISAAAVNRAQYHVFQKKSAHGDFDLVNNEQIMAVVRTDDSPITGVTWFEAAAYCNWLSEQEGIPIEQWCYEANAQGRFGEGMQPKANYLSLSGYRLPSEAEWEYACRAGAVTRRFYGHSDELLAKYAWYIENAENHTWPVGLAKPNDWGLFDMHGNVWTWCHNRYEKYGDQEEDMEDATRVGSGESRVLRGGSFDVNAHYVRSAFRDTSSTRPPAATTLLVFAYRGLTTDPLYCLTLCPPQAGARFIFRVLDLRETRLAETRLAWPIE